MDTKLYGQKQENLMRTMYNGWNNGLAQSINQDAAEARARKEADDQQRMIRAEEKRKRKAERAK